MVAPEEMPVSVKKNLEMKKGSLTYLMPLSNHMRTGRAMIYGCQCGDHWRGDARLMHVMLR